MAYDMNVVTIAYNTAKSLGASDKIILALFEAGIVESGMRNLNYGDRDSVGFLQQRPSQGWGTIAQCMDVAYATKSFVREAKKIESKYNTSGALAQGVQRSAYPTKYEANKNNALALLNKISNGNYTSTDTSNNTSTEINKIDWVTNPIGSLTSWINNFLKENIIPLTIKINIYTVLIIIILVSVSYVYAQDRIKKGAKIAIRAGKAYVTGGASELGGAK